MNYIRPHVHKQTNTWIYMNTCCTRTGLRTGKEIVGCWLLPLVFDCRCCKIVVVEFAACIVKMLLLRSKIHHSYAYHFQKANIRDRWTPTNQCSFFNSERRIDPLCSTTLILPSFIPDVDGEVTVCKLNSYYNEVRLEALNLNPKITHSNHRQVQAGNV